MNTRKVNKKISISLRAIGLRLRLFFKGVPLYSEDDLPEQAEVWFALEFYSGR